VSRAPDGLAGAELAIGINLANPLLVSGRDPDGGPIGVAPSLGAALAERAGRRFRFVSHASAGSLASATDWDVAFLADDPGRAAIAFSPPYAEIEVRYLAHHDGAFADAAEVDRPGGLVVAESGSAYALWLAANLRSAELVEADGRADAEERFGADANAVLAGLAPTLRGYGSAHPGTRLLPGRVSVVRQAIGVPAGSPAAEIAAFVRDAVASGLVAGLIDRFGVTGDLLIPG
jgi:polar amino acid transport system substrate-binding protein